MFKMVVPKKNLLKTTQSLKNLKKIIYELNQRSQENYDFWSGGSKVSNTKHLVDRMVFRINKQLGKETKGLEEQIKKDVNVALWLLARQQVNVLTPMEAFVDLNIVDRPLPLLVMQEKFASDMLDILRGTKYDLKWDEATISLLSTFPGYNVIAAGKKLHVDYDFKNALLYTKAELGEIPSIDEWSKGFAPVLSGLQQTQREMSANLPLNIFNIGTQMPFALDTFFDWRNEPLKEFHGVDAHYTYPSENLVKRLTAQTMFLPFRYRQNPPPLITYDPEGVLQEREEDKRKR